MLNRQKEEKEGEKKEEGKVQTKTEAEARPKANAKTTHKAEAAPKKNAKAKPKASCKKITPTVKKKLKKKGGKDKDKEPVEENRAGRTKNKLETMKEKTAAWRKPLTVQENEEQAEGSRSFGSARGEKELCQSKEVCKDVEEGPAP